MGRRPAARRAEPRLSGSVPRGRVDPPPLDRPRPDQHAAVGRGVVRRDRPGCDLASPGCDHRPRPAGSAHPPFRPAPTAPHWAGRSGQSGRSVSWRSRCGRFFRAGSRWFQHRFEALSSPRAMRRSCGTCAASSGGTSVGGRSIGRPGCSSPQASSTGFWTDRRFPTPPCSDGVTSRSGAWGSRSTPIESCSRATSSRSTTIRWPRSARSTRA